MQVFNDSNGTESVNPVCDHIGNCTCLDALEYLRSYCSTKVANIAARLLVEYFAAFEGVEEDDPEDDDDSS